MTRTLSKYGVIFDDRCSQWSKDKSRNVLFLKYVQDHCNQILRARGWLFLRDIYECLGIPLTKESCVVGWIYDKNNNIGDGFVDFRIDSSEEGPNITLDFNVDGCIINHFM